MKKKRVLRHCDLDLWPKVTKFNRVRASAVRRKQPFSKNRVQIGASVLLEFCSQEKLDTKTDTHTQTNCSENITPPRLRGGVKIIHIQVPWKDFYWNIMSTKEFIVIVCETMAPQNSYLSVCQSVCLSVPFLLLISRLLYYESKFDVRTCIQLIVSS